MPIHCISTKLNLRATLLLIGLLVVGSAQALLAANPFGLDSSDIIFHRKGPDTLSGYGWLNVMSVGDINHDGFDDIAFTTYKPLYRSLIFLGGNPPDTLEDYSVKGNIWAVGDFTGDGVNEVVSSYVYNQSTVPQGIVYFYRGYPDSLASEPYDSLWSPGYNAGKGEVARAAYVDDDSLADLLVCQPSTLEGPTLLYYSGGVAFDTIPDWRVQAPGHYSHYLYSHANYGFIDWNGDGQQDIYVGWHKDLDSTSFVAIYFGPNFSQMPDRTIGTPQDSGINDPLFFTDFTRAVGDVDGDGYEDLAIRSSQYMLIYCGGPQADTLYDYKLAMPCATAAAAGDVNGDGQNDLLVGLSQRHPEGGVEVLIGGSEWDVYSDGWLIRPQLPPYFLEAIGDHVSSAGDFNGDGYADLLFSTLNFSNDYVGDVFVAKGGADIVTDVHDLEDLAIPMTFSVAQNYPNPFNASTQISFDLPTASSVTMEVFNLIGQRVTTLLTNQRLSAGQHTITWDAGTAASGLYLYRLTARSFSETKKMLLLK